MNKIAFFTAVILATSFATAQTITSMNATQGPVLEAAENGGSGFTFPTFNGGAATFEQVGGDLALFVRFSESDQWIPLDGNTSSGFIYDNNWGHFWDGGGGFWFNVDKTTYIRLQSKANASVNLDYTINYNFAAREGFALTVFEGTTTLNAGNDGNLGFVFPRIGGTASKQTDWDKFVIEIEINGQWQPLNDPDRSTFHYSSGGYNEMSDKNQYAQWWDNGLSGFWFRPVTQDYRLRIGFPANGQSGGAIGDNRLIYNFVGNPNAFRPDPSTFGSIELATSDNPAIPGWKLDWADEFNGNSLDQSKWSYDIGYYLNDNPGTWGFGNGEAQHYTDNPKNVFVEGGNLNLVAYSNDPKYFALGGHTPTYSSGKVFSQNKYSFKYGRIDFRVKLPAINGAWPACWMMPQSDVYGGWAASGEIDVMEAMGRIPGKISGAIHFGGAWPENKYLHKDGYFEDDKRIDDFNVYSIVWEKESIKWYVNGKCFFIANNNEWRTNAENAKGNDFAPFDQEFFIIMNLALGGWFDPDAVLNPANFPATMQIDYVRVYKPDENSTTAINGKTSKKPISASFAGIRNGQINLNLAAGNYTAQLYDLQGRMISMKNINATNGINATGLKTGKLSKGVFVLNVKQGNASVLQQKILIK